MPFLNGLMYSRTWASHPDLRRQSTTCSSVTGSSPIINFKEEMQELHVKIQMHGRRVAC